MSTTETGARIDSRRRDIQRVIDNVSTVILGKEDVVERMLVALIAGGHCLLEDVPGVGKTMLVRAVAISLGCEFKRIQFTPDMLPADVTGFSVFNQMARVFEFRPGPVFGQIVLADEINRTSPRTQSALLEAMEERSVTVDGQVHALPEPFFVLATANPVEHEGVYPMPESQLDRFMMKVSLGYPRLDDEIAMLEQQRVAHPITAIRAVASPADVLSWRKQSTDVRVAPAVRSYLVELVRSTRAHPDVLLGASPRASIALFRAAQARAFVRDRAYVVPDDIVALAPAVLRHRIRLAPAAEVSGVAVESVIDELCARIPVPELESTDTGMAAR